MAIYMTSESLLRHFDVSEDLKQTKNGEQWIPGLQVLIGGVVWALMKVLCIFMQHSWR